MFDETEIRLGTGDCLASYVFFTICFVLDVHGRSS